MEDPQGSSRHEVPSPSATAIKANSNYLVRQWRGELSLGVSFWVNNILATVVLAAIGAALGAWVARSQSNYSVAAMWIAWWLCAAAVLVWQTVGVWRSATHHLTQTGRRFWARVAQAFVMVGGLSFAGQFVSVGIPAIQKSVELAAWMNTNATWQFRVLNNGSELEVSGGIGHGFAADMERFLDATPNVKLVHVNLGSGGLIHEAMNASDAIRARGMATYVSASCFSACTIVFLGGTQRYVNVDAKLGFHAPSIPGFTQADMRPEIDKQRIFLVSRGVSASFADHVSETTPDKMWIPSGDEMIAQGVATALTRGGEFALSGFGKHTPERADVARELGKARVYQVILSRDPALFEKLIDITSAGISTGRPMDDMRRDTLPIIAKMYADSLPYSSRDALIRSARLMAAEFRALQAAPGKTCLHYAMTSDATASNAAVKYFSREIAQEELEAMADAIESSDRRRAVPRIEDVQPQLAEAVRIVEAKTGKDAAILAQLSDPDVDPAAACRAITAYFDALASLSPQHAEMALRATFGAK